MTNSRSFIIFALVLAIVVVVGQIILTFFLPKRDTSGTSIESIVLLPTSLNDEVLGIIDEKASKYLLITKEQFSNGQTAGLNTTVTPTVTGGGIGE